ncbi:polysaccharide biosynthesis/export family protein [Kolteria novifilia]
MRILGQAIAWRNLCFAMACSVLFTGCSITPDTGLTTFPVKYHLIKPAKQMRGEHVTPIAVPRELAKTPLLDYLVEPGDVLEIEPAKVDSILEFPSNQPIPPDGTVDLARYGRITVMGMTIDDIEDAINAKIKAESKNPIRVEVRLLQWNSKVYYVEGEVRAPGAYPLDGRETVLDAIFAAGGLNNKASRKNIILSRPTDPCGCRVVLPICYDNIFQLGDTTTNYQIQPGDRIYVATRRLCEDCPFLNWIRGNKGKLCCEPQFGCILPTEPCCAEDGCLEEGCVMPDFSAEQGPKLEGPAKKAIEITASKPTAPKLSAPKASTPKKVAALPTKAKRVTAAKPPSPVASGKILPPPPEFVATSYTAPAKKEKKSKTTSDKPKASTEKESSKNDDAKDVTKDAPKAPKAGKVIKSFSVLPEPEKIDLPGDRIDLKTGRFSK